MFAGAGLFSLLSNIQHQFGGADAVATVMERSAKCSVEFQFVGADKRTNLDLACKEAEAFQNEMGSKKVKLKRVNYAQLKLVTQDGATLEVTVANSAAAAGKGVGAVFPVVYDPAKPEDVRAPLTLASALSTFGFMLMGLAMVFASLGFNPLRLFRRSDAAQQPQIEGDSLEKAMSALARASESRASPAAAPASYAAPGPRAFGRRKAA
jgi:hypothetical protein